jgi:hypothetical protein
MTHDGMLDLAWKWLPKTALFLQGGASFIDYLNPSGAPPTDPRDDSTQVRGLAGLRGLISPKTTVLLQAGYQTAFYPAGSPNPSGVSNLEAAFELGYLINLLSRADLRYNHGFRNSPVIGDFYDSDSGGLSYSHQLGHLVGSVHGTVDWRRYHNYEDVNGNPLDRKDLLFGAGISFDYYIQRWFFAGASYGVTVARPSGDPAAVDYTKHQVFARLGLAY